MVHLHRHRVQLRFASVELVDGSVGLNHLLSENLSRIHVTLLGRVFDLSRHLLLLSLDPLDLSLHSVTLFTE